ncbi:MAG TPA: hypothetical protein PLC54_03745 [Spirochaetales bacterium]|nr:hypothetical protein [Spirochaetales bacterium]
MNSLAAMIAESVFNVAYLSTVWVLVFLMAKASRSLQGTNAGIATRFTAAFALLAAGDTFHVGARVAQALVGAERTVSVINGVPSSWIGLGMLATAYTMTVFYMLLADAARKRSGKPGVWFWIVQSLLCIRLVLMALPGNAWESSNSPYVMGLVRNLPLTLAGLTLAFVFLRDGKRLGNTTWTGIGFSMLASYAFYLPVILFANAVPALGLLMIPKTVAYVVLGLFAYRMMKNKAPEQNS